MKRLFILMMTLLLVGSGFAQVLVEETFENGNADGQPPVGWICNDGGWKCGYQEKDHNRIPHEGDWYVYSTYNTDVWMYKEINVTADVWYKVSFWHVTNPGDQFDLQVKVGNSPTPEGMTHPILSMVVDNDEYQQAMGVFQPTVSGTRYVGFHSVANNLQWYMSLDDIVIEEVEPYNFKINKLTPDTTAYFGEPVKLRFSVTNTGAMHENVTLSVLTSSDLQGVFYVDGSQVTSLQIPFGESVEVDAVATLPLDLTNHQELHFQAHVASMHNANMWPVDFKITAMEPYNDFPLEEGFENDFVPFGWQNNITNGNYAFDRITEGSTPSAMPQEGQYMARFYTYTNPSGGSAELVSPKLDLSEHDNIVRFWMYRNSNPNINRDDRINVYYNTIASSEGGQLLGTIHRCTYKEPVIADVDDWYEYSFTFDCPDDYGFIIFEGVSDYGWNLYLDDIFISNSSVDNDPPVLVSVTGNQTYADTEMNLEIRVRDASAMPATLAATYSIWGVTHDLTFTRAGKANYDYTATIPAYDNHTHGTMTVQLVDVLDNSVLSDEIPIRWDYQKPLLYETFEECSSMFTMPEGWTTSGNQTWWDWTIQGTVYYTDYYGQSLLVEPHSGNKQAVLEWDSSENPQPQDQTLITPVLTITRPTVLEFWTCVLYGTDGYDHFVVRVYDTYNGTWDDKWDAADQFPQGFPQQYGDPISINLDEYIGKNIKIGFRGYNDFGEFLAFDWFIDDVKVIPTDTTDVNVNELAALKLNVYPNPAKDVVCIEAAQPIQNVQLMGINGVLLEDRKTNSNKVELNLEGYSKGIYVVRIVTEEGVATKKINLIE